MSFPERAGSSAALHFFAAAYLLVAMGAPGAALAQPTGDPISTSAPLAAWALELEDVVQIPNSAGMAPRLEQLVGHPATGLAYVIDQRGTIYAFDPAAPLPSASVFLDLAAAVGSLHTQNESGVRSLAFHPDFDVSGSDGERKMYVAFSRTTGSTPIGGPVVFGSPGPPDHVTVISEWTLDSGGSVELGSYRELIRIEQPFANHNAGHLGFDPSATPGMATYAKLFISVGDGGSGGGPFDLSQDIDATPAPYPHGKILRIDPIASGAAPYTVPPDNPFAGVADRVTEIWAYGFRNPHKFEWDPMTGHMVVSDIGQGVVEEISLVRGGGNYGWNRREGSFVYANGVQVSPLPAGHVTDVFEYPVAQYDHQGNGITGSSAIVGGPIYRGAAIPALYGTMLFADFATNPGPIFAVSVDDLTERDDFTNLANFSGGRLAPFEEVLIRDAGADKTFRQFLRDANGSPGISRTDLRWGVGADGEIYLLNKRDGMVRRISAAPDHPGVPQPVPGLALLGSLAAAAILTAIGVQVTTKQSAG